MRRTAMIPAAGLALAAVLTGCSSPKPGPTPTAVTVVTPSSAPTGAPSSPPAPAVALPSCAQIKNAMVGGTTDPYNTFGSDGVPLTDGVFSGEGGLVLEAQQACTSGKLGGQIGEVRVGTILHRYEEATGRWWSVMLCRTAPDRPKCTVPFNLNDREPIESLSISGGKLKVVYLTRADSEPMAMVSIRRTAIYRASGAGLVEESRTDASI